MAAEKRSLRRLDEITIFTYTFTRDRAIRLDCRLVLLSSQQKPSRCSAATAAKDLPHSGIAMEEDRISSSPHENI
jgi:hypothetical protein